MQITTVVTSVILLIGGIAGFIYFGKTVPIDLENGLEWEWEYLEPVIKQMASLLLAIVGIIWLIRAFRRG